jgi:triphosphatase
MPGWGAIERASVILDIDRARIEAALDEGRIAAHDRTIAVGELELELKEGEKAALFRLACTLAQRAPISLSFISKAERGSLSR